MQKGLITIIVIIIFIQLCCMALFMKSCVCFTKDGYREMAWSGFDGVYESLYFTDHISQKDIDNYKLYSESEDSIYYKFEWYQISDTNDSIFVSGRIRKRFPHVIGVSSSISTNFLRMYRQGETIRGMERNSDGTYVKWRRTLNNLFDTSVVNVDNVIDYICLLPADSMSWTVEKEKIAEYIRKGYYTIESNKSDPMVIGFYNYVGVVNKVNKRYKISKVAVIRMGDNVIGLSLDNVEYIPGNYDRDNIYEEIVEMY